MKRRSNIYFILTIGFLVCLLSICCKTIRESEKKHEFVVAFGSCSKQYLPQLWDEVLETYPNIWIWTGDIVYPRKYTVEELKKGYALQKSNPKYQKLISQTKIIGSWDDHDYGLNDGGTENVFKKESQQLLLDFLDVPKTSIRRDQEGIYSSHSYKVRDKVIKIIVLDTRYFRTPLTPSKEKNKRYIPNLYGSGTMLGKKQWEWFEKEMDKNPADFNIIVSSIQLLTDHMGFESWATMPHERDKMLKILSKKKAKRVVFLTGDRHFAEISKVNIPDLPHPVYDITSSGLTHTNKPNQNNSHRISPAINQLNFGVLYFDGLEKSLKMEFKSKNNKVLYSYTLKF